MQGDTFAMQGGWIGPRGARLWLFVGFVLGFAAVIASCWILVSQFKSVTKGKCFFPFILTAIAIYSIAKANQNLFFSFIKILVNFLLIIFSLLKNNICLLFFIEKDSLWVGTALFLQNLFIFAGSLVFKFGRVEDPWR